MASSPNNTASAQPAAGRPQPSHPSPSPVYQQQQQYYLNNSNCQNLPPRSQTQIPISSPPPPAQNGIVYPLASSGRGFVPGTLRPSSDHSFPLSNNTTPTTTTLLLRGTFNPSSSALSYRPASPSPLLSHPQYPALSRQTLVPSPPAIKGIPLPCQLMVAPSPSPVSDSSGYKNTRDVTDDAVIVVRDRKVRVSGGASLYALCRSWLRNGVAEESQTPYSEGAKTLPRPLPLPVVDSTSPSKEDEGEDTDQAEETVEHLSAQDLLKRHIKHAKKVRARLREERLSRIARYKTRLALLLPPQAEQLRNDTAAGN
ncbi:unnamed protein product [Linum tenue]|uniref:Uncharacterized protein n=1 Tax=Linum tenue TaxID=586396 RepID=A0AAV0L057_9ROSI|nr:unnamed protein product [Linum tenue]